MDKYILVCVLLLILVEMLCVTAVFTADWIVSYQFGEMSTRVDSTSAVRTCLCH